MLSRTHTAILQGLHAIPIEVEIDAIRGTPNLLIIGLPSKTVDEARERITASLLQCGVRIKAKKTIVNLAPAEVHKNSSAVELAIAVGLLQLYEAIPPFSPDTIFFGELSLDGRLKPVRGALALVQAAKKLGFEHVVLPRENQAEVTLVKSIHIHPVARLQDLVQAQRQGQPLPVLQPSQFTPTQATTSLSHIAGQAQAKRALEVAITGGHNLLMIGPPGAGKSLLAQASLSLLPPLTEEEALEVTTIYSVAGKTSAVITNRPFRAPHHTTSITSLLGGSSQLNPGEITLAHRGILFLDELPEFSRSALEAMRQPLEQKTITITRANGSITYPANFILLAAANPCPCGYYLSNQKPCQCQLALRQKYLKKISGPLLDRIDLHVVVPRVNIQELVKAPPQAASLELARVLAARDRQNQRLHQMSYSINAEIAAPDLAHLVPLQPKARALLNRAAERLALSARSYHKLTRVARTIADLEASQTVEEHHLAEALHYREAASKLLQ